MLATLALLFWVVWAYRHTLTDFSTFQRRFSLTVRTLILILLALALAGLTVLHPTRERMVVLLTDQSRSIDENARKSIEEYVEKVQTESAGKPLLVIPFGTETETNIAAALEPALAMIAPFYVPHLVVLTDGNETRGDFLTAAKRSGAPVSTVPTPDREAPEVQLVELRAPVNVRQGEPFNLEVVVESNRKTEAAITVFRGDFKVAEDTKPLEIGENVFIFKQAVDNQRQVEFSATIESPDDTIWDNNAARRLVFVGGTPRVLLIESDPKMARDFIWAMREQEIEVEPRPAEGLPTHLDDLENFEALILSNVPATALTMRQMDLVRTYVRDLGGGFIMLGGEQSFGLGGYYKTPIEEILPVRSDFEKEKEKQSLGIALVIDRSGSMGGEKMELAKTAARGAVELLTPRDLVGVIAFDHQSYVICPMQTPSSRVDAEIATIQAGGGTAIYPAMVDAYDQLSKAVTKIKHVILLTDGVSSPGDFEGITRQMLNAQITVSTVAVGDDSDRGLLEQIAQIGQGRSYFCNDPQSIPQIFAKETMTASKSAIHELPFTPQLIVPTDVLAGVELDTAPPLLGFVVTRPKPTSQFILATETGEPLLVWWRYGLGISVAFTSDAKSRWAAEWLTWPDFPTFWAQIVRHTMRKSETRGVLVDMDRKDGKVRVSVDAVDDTERFINRATGTLTVTEPAAFTEPDAPTRNLTQTAPGRYEATFETDKRGGYHFQTTLRAGEKIVASAARGLSVGYSDELRLRPVNVELLQQVATETGGVFDPDSVTLFDPDPLRVAWRARALSGWLLALAAALFVLDVFLRRIEIGASPAV